MPDIKTKPIPHFAKGSSPMDNEQIINTIQALLEDESALNPQVAAKLTLSLVAQLYLKVDDLSNKFSQNNLDNVKEVAYLKTEIEDLRANVAEAKSFAASIKADVDNLKATSVIMWSQKHPKLAMALGTVMFLIAVYAVELKNIVYALLGFRP